MIVHANKTKDTEAVRYSINKNYDLLAINVSNGQQHPLTVGPGPEVSPRIAPDGSHLVCLSSPRKGPHADIFNLLIVPLTGPEFSPRVLYDHHTNTPARPPHAVPTFPLPDQCWESNTSLVYNTQSRLEGKTYRVDIASGKGSELNIDANNTLTKPSPVVRNLRIKHQLTPPSNPFLKHRLKAPQRIISWQNERLELQGVLTLPPETVAKPPYPLVLFPHGGPHSRATTSFNFTANIFAHAGYAVFQPNFRGSSGYGKQFLDADRNDLGGGDMRDILSGIEELTQQKLIDPNRQFVYGVSYGGFMTTWLVGHTTQFRAAVAQNAVTDMNAMWGLSDIQSWTEYELGGRPWEVADKMRNHSPFAYAHKVQTPTLILHSRDDRRCPLPMGQMFHQALVARDVPTQMVIYPDEGHGIRQPKHQVDVLKRTLAWFAEHDGESSTRK